MSYVVAVLAGIVAVEYVVIAVDVVPRLARLSSASGVLVVARWGAAAFFLGCAVTHLAICVDALGGGGGHGSVAHSGAADLLLMVVPHLAQVFGGAAFIVVAKRRLEIDVLTKDEAGRLRELARRFRAAFDRAPTGIAVVGIDAHGRPGPVIQVNPALCTLLGAGEDEVLGRSLRSFVHPGDVWLTEDAYDDLVHGRTETVTFEERLVGPKGAVFEAALVASVLRDDDDSPRYVVVLVRDVTEERRGQARIRYLAEHDSLTGTMNRHRFGEELDRAVASAARYGEQSALLVVDLDQFKYVNDTYGHRAGDALLQRVADVLRNRLRSSDVLGRLGGDEFGVLCPHTDVEEARSVAAGLVTALREQAHVEVEGRDIRITASVGIRPIVVGETGSGEQMLAEADIAMYESKERGRDRVTAYSPVAGALEMRSRLTWSERIREALDHDGLRLYEQPIVSLRDGEPGRSELLVRMVLPDGSVVLPGRFLEVAERFGQVQAIDRWVFERTVTLLARRQALGDRSVVEVNLSAVSMCDVGAIDALVEIISSSPADPTCLVVEITETAAISNLDLARRAAGRLSDLGCRFALDDFGSGFGSFYYLKHLPFDGVKIDGDFIRDLPRSRVDRLTVEAIVATARGLGKEITAEFVQDDETLDVLRELGVDYAQGFHLGHPVPVRELELPELVV